METYIVFRARHTIELHIVTAENLEEAEDKVKVGDTKPIHVEHSDEYRCNSFIYLASNDY